MFCVEKDEINCVTLCFPKLNVKISWKPSGKGNSSVQKLGLFFQSQYLLTFFPAETVAMK